MSLVDYPDEYRIHINLIEIGKDNRGKQKEIEHIAGCLIAFACQIAFDKNYFGFVFIIDNFFVWLRRFVLYCYFFFAVAPCFLYCPFLFAAAHRFLY